MCTRGLVITDKISNKKAVNHGDIISKLVGSVQLLDKKINDLRASFPRLVALSSGGFIFALKPHQPTDLT